MTELLLDMTDLSYINMVHLLLSRTGLERNMNIYDYYYFLAKCYRECLAILLLTLLIITVMFLYLLLPM